MGVKNVDLLKICSNLNDYQLKTSRYSSRPTYKNLMVTTS